VIGKSQIKSQVQITNHLQKWFKSMYQITDQITNHILKSQIIFYQNLHFLKMINLYNLIYQKSHHI